MHAGHRGAQASEVQAEIVTGMEGCETFMERRERRASLRWIGAGRQKSLRLKLRSKFLLDVGPAAVRIGGLLVFLHPLAGIQRMGSVYRFLRCFGSAGTGGPRVRVVPVGR